MIEEILKNAGAAAASVQSLEESKISEILIATASELRRRSDEILAANREDLSKMSPDNPRYDRLLLSAERLDSIASDMESVASLPSPLGLTLDEWTRPNGMKIKKISVPFGVIGVIYEARPNVTADVFSLCLKSGNVCVLRGGKEAFRSANAIVEALREGLTRQGIPETAVNLVQDTSRAGAEALMTANGYIDLLIPRGGAGLINACLRTATVPCIATGTGICHVYVEKTADLDMALAIVENAKTSRPSVCNAEEALLVDRAIAPVFLPMLLGRIGEKVELRLDEESQAIIPGVPAGEKDFDTEFLDYILAVKCVENVEEAVAHISAHSTGHSEAIVTRSPEAERYFTANVDSAAVYVNASTRFTDGGEFGLGCEMGISTQKLHARGPMGLRELTTYKYIVHGNGHIR